MTIAPLHLAGERLQLDPAGGLDWPAQRLLAENYVGLPV